MNILITGASRGIGAELVKLASKEVGNQIFMLSRNKSALENLTHECRLLQPYSRLVSLDFDLTDAANLATIFQRVAGEAESLDILINNAGYLVAKPFTELTYTETEQMYKVNILGPLELIRTFMPLLLKSEKAHVVNISSMGGFQGSVKFPGLTAYASSKAALAGLTECLAEEFKDTSLAFNCLALGAVATEMLAEAFPGYQAPNTAADMARFIWNFAQEGHQFFNGKIIPVSKSTP